ncbi:hypothetical protein ACIBH1_05355 [Nonomuraea sp. NPDC050663]|uniref:hypothetical protein n=1 Tax=Nonomuraea sp. NPDC050663 TaxID=3364370 RepID=UPI0037A9F823
MTDFFFWLIEQPRLVGRGWRSWASRAWDGMTHGVHRRQIRAAEAIGDAQLLGEWVERRQRAKLERTSWLISLPAMVAALTVMAFRGGIVAVIGLAALGVVVEMTGPGRAAALMSGIGAFFGWIVWAVGALAWALVHVGPFILIWAGRREGLRVSESGTSGWTVGEEPETEGRQVVPDEGAIIVALQNLGISPLNRAFRAGWRPRVVLPTQRDGKGYRTQMQLPPGVTVEMINLKKKVLAHNLVRFPVEVWPTEPRNLPGVLDMWVADQGSLTGPVPPWPLLEDGDADYFKGVPVSVDIRGKTIVGRLSEANYAIAGQMGSGKSTLVITLLLGALLDPLVDADVFVMAANADFEPMRRRLRTLQTGAGDEVVESCMAALRDAYADLSVRGQALREHDARAVTRELAMKDSRLRPRILVIDECQALFMHEEYGEEAEDLAVKLESAARKYAVSLVYATPEPSSDSLPRRLIAITSNRACFSIGDQRSNDAILGTGSYKTGISAMGLEPKTDEGPGDVGTFMARGFTSKPALLRGYFVSQSDAHRVIDRCMANLEQACLTATGRPAMEQRRDLLQDVAAVLGEETLPAADVPPLLAKLAPRWLPYRGLTGVALREQLAELGAQVPSTGNRWPISPELIQAALVRAELGDDVPGDALEQGVPRSSGSWT